MPVDPAVDETSPHPTRADTAATTAESLDASTPRGVGRVADESSIRDYRRALAPAPAWLPAPARRW